MKYLVILILLTFSFNSLHGKDVNPFDAWSTCPKNRSELKGEIEKLDKIIDQFANLKGDQKMKILDRSDWQAVYLEHLGAFLLPSNMRSEVAKSCWSNYEDIRRAVAGGDGKHYKESVVAWKACLNVKYKPVPGELQQMIGCFEKLSWPNEKSKANETPPDK